MFRVFYEEKERHLTFNKSVVIDKPTPQECIDAVREAVKARGNTCIVRKTKRVSGTRAHG